MSELSSSRHELWVRPDDLDTNGHVNHARLVSYLEAARWTWLAANEISLTPRVVAVVTRIEVDYLREVAYGRVSIETHPVEPDPDRDPDLRFRAELTQTLEASGTPCLDARIQLAFIDAKTRRPVSLGEFLRAAAPA